jgi:predicted XRE-type DNA-binding protein
MRVDHELKRQLVRHVCALAHGWNQIWGAAYLKITQPQLSALRRGRADGFSVGRLLRVIADRHYDIEVHLKPMPRPYSDSRRKPTVTVVRYDRFGRRVEM